MGHMGEQEEDHLQNQQTLEKRLPTNTGSNTSVEN